MQEFFHTLWVLCQSATLIQSGVGHRCQDDTVPVFRFPMYSRTVRHMIPAWNVWENLFKHFGCKERLLFKHLWCKATVLYKNLECKAIFLFKHFGCKERLLFNYFGCQARLWFKHVGANQHFCLNSLGAKQDFSFWVQSKTFV